MADSITVSTVDLAAAVKQAAMVAPVRGAALDKAGGILFEVQGDQLLLKATDLETSYRCAVAVSAQSGMKPLPRRVPAPVLRGYMGNLSDHPGDTVITFNDTKKRVEFKTGKGKRVSLASAPIGGFPEIDQIDTSQSSEVPDLMSAMQRVQWSIDPKDNAPMCGVHLTGDFMVAVTRSSAAMVPCAVPLAEPITVPLSSISSALRGVSGGVRLGQDRTNRLVLSPNPEVQFSTTIYADMKFPNYKLLMEPNCETVTTVMDKDQLVSAADRVSLFLTTLEQKRVSILATDDWMDIEADIPDVGRIEEVVGLEEELDEDVEVAFDIDPSLLRDAVAGVVSTNVTIAWPANGVLKPIVITGEGDGYRAVIMPLRIL